MIFNKDKYRGLIATILFHAMIIALLIFLGFTTPLPLPGEEGVEVNLGMDMQGSGTIQPEKPATIKKTTPPPKQAKAKEEIVTQDTEDAPSMKTDKGEKQEKITTEKVDEEKVEEAPKVNPAALYKGKSKDANENASEGITGEEGDQGKPSGTKTSKNYIGEGGFGDGKNWSLNGRKPTYLPKPSNEFTENGTVVVQITVNRYGKVTKANAIDKGSTTTNSKLRRLAEEAAKKAIFNANPDAAEFQRGTITYHFIVKN
jgi:TonB family protein